MAKVRIILPPVLTKIAKEKSVEVEASTLIEALNVLSAKYGEDFRNRIFESSGKPRRLLNFYINGKNCEFLKGMETKLNEGDIISILPLASGG